MKYNPQTQLNNNVSNEILSAQLTNPIIKTKSLQIKLSPFIQKLNMIIKQYYSDETFDVNGLCQKLCLCNMQVHRKIKKQTGLTPGKYLLHYRLEVAIALLQSSEFSIGEVAFQVGFSNHNNFSRAFKREIGFSPQQLKASSYKY